MARQPIVAANWKMHKTHLEAIRDVQKLSYLLAKEDAERVEVVICPAFTALRPVGTLIEGDRLPYRLGAQTVHHEERGAFTGEVSPEMLAALKVQYVIVGHSERRQFFHETDQTVSRKAQAALSGGLVPIVCVGETLALLAKPEMRDKLTKSGFEVQAKTGQQHMERVAREIPMFRDVITKAGIKLKSVDLTVSLESLSFFLAQDDDV